MAAKKKGKKLPMPRYLAQSAKGFSTYPTPQAAAKVAIDKWHVWYFQYGTALGDVYDPLLEPDEREALAILKKRAAAKKSKVRK